MNEIPERAYVIAERLRDRQSSETQIRAALTEYELSEKQIKQVLKQTELEGPIIQFPVAERGYIGTKSINPMLRGQVGTPSVGKRPSLKEDIIGAWLSGGARLLLYIILAGTLFILSYWAMLNQAAGQ